MFPYLHCTNRTYTDYSTHRIRSNRPHSKYEQRHNRQLVETLPLMYSLFVSYATHISKPSVSTPGLNSNLRDVRPTPGSKFIVSRFGTAIVHLPFTILIVGVLSVQKSAYVHSFFEAIQHFPLRFDSPKSLSTLLGLTKFQFSRFGTLIVETLPPIVTFHVLCETLNQYYLPYF